MYIKKNLFEQDCYRSAEENTLTCFLGVIAIHITMKEKLFSSSLSTLNMECGGLFSFLNNPTQNCHSSYKNSYGEKIVASVYSYKKRKKHLSSRLKNSGDL